MKTKFTLSTLKQLCWAIRVFFTMSKTEARKICTHMVLAILRQNKIAVTSSRIVAQRTQCRQQDFCLQLVVNYVVHKSILAENNLRGRMNLLPALNKQTGS